MGKNLTWLIDEAKQPTRRGEYYYDVWQTIMMNHGEALIAALEAVVALSDDEDYPYASIVQAKALLAQLESEAKP